MKKMRKLLAVILTLIMAMVMMVPAMTAEEKTYTITAPDNGHTYEVYQVFTGDYYNGVLSNIKWGQNGTGTAGEAVSSEIITELTGATGSDTEKLAVIEKYVNLESEEFGTVSNGNPLTVPGGYYLIKDVDGSQAGEDDAYTLYIVQVVNDVTISPKADVPEFEKKVQDADDTAGTTTEWQDSADHDIGDTINFQLSGTVADNYDAYKVYKFVFHDNESAGLTFQKVTAVKVDGEQNPLEGAEFTLEKFVADEEGTETYNEVKGNWTSVGAAEVTEEGTKFTFKGLDDGAYRLTETKTPDGYNTIEPIIFTVTAEHEIESDNPALTSLNGNKVSGEITFTPNQGEGSLTATVVNQSGLELPETGGMGTKIFYLAGGILALGAGLLLVTRKRMEMR